MKRLWSILGESFHVLAPVAMIALGVGGFMVFGQRPEPPPREVRRDSVAAVETTPVKATDGRFTVEVDGVALSYRQITHSAQVAGEIIDKIEQCRSGHFVAEDQYLLEIDPSNYQLEIERLEVQIEQADANLSESSTEIGNVEALIELAKEDVKLQRDNLGRIQDLMKRGASTDTQLDTARKQELTARNALQTLLNQLSALKQRTITLTTAKKLAQTQLKRAKLDLDRTKVAAPITGTLITVNVEEGVYVKAGDPLFMMNDTSTMEVSCQLRVDELYWVWLTAGTMSLTNPPPSDADIREKQFEIPNVPVEVAYEFRGVEYLWDGVLSRYDGTGLDPATRTIPCRVRVDEPTKVRVGGDGVAGAVAPPTLFSGMYVKVRIPIDSPLPMLEIPIESLRPGGEVWVVRDNALAILQADVARVADVVALLRFTSSGPQPGDRIITSPVAAVKDGLPVNDISTEVEQSAEGTAADAEQSPTNPDQDSPPSERTSDSAEVQP
ncbi:MAG: biotin/lipoyl-binding protein [Planctomycetaceae bacterium]|nr:biotin/lipoyl-binding protein [Planctomycetaceae bacterium]